MEHKILKTILLLGLLCTSLSSCDSGKSYHLEVLDYFNSDIIVTSLRTGDYKEGEVLQVVTHKLMDAGVYVYLNDKSITSREADNHWIFEFEMPSYDSTLVISADPYYLKDTFILDDFLMVDDFIKNGEVKEVRAEFGYVGVAPGSLNQVYYSDNEDDLEKALSLFEEKLERSDGQPSGGNYMLITYFPNDEYDYEQTYQITNNRISDGDFGRNNLFEFVNNVRGLFDFNDVKLSSFTFNNLFKGNNVFAYYVKTSIGTYEETTKEFDSLSYLEFIPYEGEVEDDLGYLTSPFIDKISIYSEKIFSYKNKMYQLISDYDFSALI